MRTQWDAYIRDFGKVLRHDNKSPRTIEGYTDAATFLADWLAEHGKLVHPADLTRYEIGEWIAHLTETRSASTADTRYRALRQFFKFLIAEGEIDEHPMRHMSPPAVPEKPVDVVPLPVIKALLNQCSGRDLVSRRDTAIVRLLMDTGGRLSEIGNLTVEDLDLEQDQIAVLGKGRRPRVLPIGSNTSLALSRYLRVRATHRHAKRPQLWLADKNRPPMTARPPVPTHRRTRVVGQRWQRDGLDAADGVALTADAPPLRRVARRRAGTRRPPQNGVGGPDLSPFSRQPWQRASSRE